MSLRSSILPSNTESSSKTTSRVLITFPSGGIQTHFGPRRIPTSLSAWTSPSCLFSRPLLVFPALPWLHVVSVCTQQAVSEPKLRRRCFGHCQLQPNQQQNIAATPQCGKSSVPSLNDTASLSLLPKLASVLFLQCMRIWPLFTVIYLHVSHCAPSSGSLSSSIGCAGSSSSSIAPRVTALKCLNRLTICCRSEHWLIECQRTWAEGAGDFPHRLRAPLAFTESHDALQIGDYSASLGTQPIWKSASVLLLTLW